MIVFVPLSSQKRLVPAIRTSVGAACPSAIVTGVPPAVATLSIVPFSVSLQ
jgi:hypothetical protein